MFFFVQGWVLLTHPHCLLVWRKINLHQRHPRKMWTLHWVLFGYLRGFWDASSPRLWVPVWRDNQPKCWMNRRCVLFWSWFATHNHIHSRVLRNCFHLEKRCDRFFICQNNCWFCCFPQNLCKLMKCHVICQKLFLVCGHLELRGGEYVRAKR